MKIRVGVPLTGGQMVRFVHERSMPVLFSANAFFSKDKDGRRHLRTVTLPTGLDAALDSAGFVAMVRYGGRYPWSEDEYLDLVAAYPWAWYSARDMCVEAEVASDRLAVRMRLAGTIHGYYGLARLAAERGLQSPIPVLQGRTLADYLWCADRLPVDVPLVGLGSFCRREIGGPEGVVTLVEQIDRYLPKQTRLHLFGVKGGALSYLSGHPRVASIDSMAWDSAARFDQPTGRTMDYRLRMMEAWVQRNVRNKTRRLLLRPPQGVHRATVTIDPDEETDDVASWMELVEGGEIDYASAMAHMRRLWVGAPLASNHALDPLE